MKRVIFLPNWVGDVVMATPALRLLREGWPNDELVGIVRPPTGQVVAELGLLDRLMPYEPRKAASPHRGLRFLHEFRQQSFATAVLLTNSLHTAWLAWAGGARRRVGFDRDGRRWLLTDPVPCPQRKIPHPVVNDYLQLAATSLGMEFEPFHAGNPPRMAATVTTAGRLAWEQCLAQLPTSAQQRPLITLNTGGAFGPAKNWPGEHFSQLAVKLADSGTTVIAVCGPAERDAVRAIAAQANHPFVFSLANSPPSLDLTAAALAASQLLITTDSGPRHLATALGIRVLTLYGPTDPAWSETFAPHAEPLRLELPCSPCQQRVCPLQHHACLRDLSVETVFQRATSMLTTSPALVSAVCASH